MGMDKMTFKCISCKREFKTKRTLIYNIKDSFAGAFPEDGFVCSICQGLMIVLCTSYPYYSKNYEDLTKKQKIIFDKEMELNRKKEAEYFERHNKIKKKIEKLIKNDIKNKNNRRKRRETKKNK